MSNSEEECIKRTISQKLKEVMLVADLDEATSIQVSVKDTLSDTMDVVTERTNL